MSVIISGLLSFIHFSIWLILRWTHLIYSHLNLTFQRLTYLLEVSNNYHNTDTINQDLNSIQKRPQHLAVILDYNPTFSYQLAKLANWCIITKIPQLTLYLSQPQIELALKNLLESHEKVQKPYYSLEPFVIKQDENQFFYYSKEETLILTIKLICLSQSKSELSGVINQLIQSRVIDQKLDSQVELIHQTLQDEGLLQGPNLIIAPKYPFTFRHFPPMGLRTAEISTNPFNDRLIYPVFLQALKTYSTTQQRNGK